MMADIPNLNDRYRRGQRLAPAIPPPRHQAAAVHPAQRSRRRWILFLSIGAVLYMLWPLARLIGLQVVQPTGPSIASAHEQVDSNAANAPVEVADATPDNGSTVAQPSISAQSTVIDCPGAMATQLSIGMQAVVSSGKVNVRKEPVVPDNYYANVVVGLYQGETVTIIDGPHCVYNGYWWEVETKDKRRGWMREEQHRAFLLSPSS